MQMILTDEEVNTSITHLYDNIAKRLGYDPSKCRYDCRRIAVANNIFERVYAYYEREELYGMEGMAMAWCSFGPKCCNDLSDYTVSIADDFIIVEE